MSTSHRWTGDPAQVVPYPQIAQAPEYRPGTTTARRVRKGGSVRVFTRRYRTVLFAIIVFFGGVLAVGPTSEFWAGDAAAIREVTGLVAGVFAVFAYRVLRLGITVKPGVVVIRNLVGNHRVRAAHLDHFEPPRDGTFRTGIRVVRKSGRVTRAIAFSSMNNFERPDRGVYETVELNAWLSVHNNDVTPGPLTPLRPFSRRATVLWRIWLAALWLEVALASLLVINNLTSPLSN